MARWKPDSTSVGPNEHIARRLFDRPSLKGGSDQADPPDKFPLYHFEEERDEGHVSVDRLGKTGIDGKVRRYLLPRARRAENTFRPPAAFLGWAVVTARLIREARDPLEVRPSPIEGDAQDDLSKNEYHADIMKPAGIGYYTMAVYLKHLFHKKPHFEPWDGQPTSIQPPATEAAMAGSHEPVAQPAPSQAIAAPLAAPTVAAAPPAPPTTVALPVGFWRRCLAWFAKRFKQ